MSLTLKTPIVTIGPIGKAVGSRLKKIELLNAEDLLWHFPFRYDDYSQLKTINKLTDSDVATIRGKVELIDTKRSKVKRTIVTEALVADETGTIKAVWFNQPFLTKVLQPGDEIFLSGKVDFDYYGYQFVSPEYEKIGRTENLNTARLVPVYSSTTNVTQKQLRFLIKQILKLAKETENWLPEMIEGNLQLMPLPTALEQIHFPTDQQTLTEAKKRLKFEEHFLFHLQSQAIKQERQQGHALEIKFQEQATKEFVSSLPFQLTNDQKKSAWEILQDIQKDRPMNRLLEGDVGSGKTVVATIAILNTVLNNFQAILMAPTEILASQHFQTISKLFANLDINIALLTRTQAKLKTTTEDYNSLPKSKIKKTILELIKNQTINLIIGTHTILEEKVIFKNLALVIIDEQQRFGVNQRHQLNIKDDKNNFNPHFLSMSATPIPRSLALSLTGSLDLSLIQEMPKNRKPVMTKIVDTTNREKAYQFIREQVKNNKQVFVICPLIDPSDNFGFKSVEEEFIKLSQKVFPNLVIGKLHGRLKKEEKADMMQKFINNEINILVSTSVVEVGVDIPNATVMMIEGADRFGLSQLHQFRGRVGRSDQQSYCLLFTESTSQKVKNRLEALVSCHNGFELAEKDLALRGPGEIYGTKQSGVLEFKIATLGDIEIIKLAKTEAEKIISTLDSYPMLKNRLAVYNKQVHLE